MTIQTSDVEDADTNSEFYYTFIGSKGNTSEHHADAVGDRQKSKTDTWAFTDSADIGVFKCILIRMDGTDGWHFKEVGLKCFEEFIKMIESGAAKLYESWKKLCFNLHSVHCNAGAIIDPMEVLSSEKIL